MKQIQEAISKQFGNRPEKILQFGEGNFLRAFVDWMIDMANREGLYEGSIVLCQPIETGLCDLINQQNGLYTVVMRGLEKGQPLEKEHVVQSISRCLNPYTQFDDYLALAHSADLEVIISNTTESGIQYNPLCQLTDRPPASFPAKICQFLYRRFDYFNGAEDKGLLLLPVELIDDNGSELLRCVLKYAEQWQLPDAFVTWVNQANTFCSTLVDRIVTGYPREEAEAIWQRLGYQDQLLTTCELFNLWVIESAKDARAQLPLDQTSAHVIWTDDVTPYKMRKVRILNGAHTGSVLAAVLAGHETVLEMMNDALFADFIAQMLDQEVKPHIPLDPAELNQFAEDVITRFKNPFIRHRLLDISLNSTSKWATRCLPSLLDHLAQKSELPVRLTFSLAALLRFYKPYRIENGQYFGQSESGQEYPLRDNAEALELFAEAYQTENLQDRVNLLLSQSSLWAGHDLADIPGLSANVAHNLQTIEQIGISRAIAQIS